MLAVLRLVLGVGLLAARASAQYTCPIPLPPPPPAPPHPNVNTFTVYRVQGGSWFHDVSNSDVGDAGGEACFLSEFTGELSADAFYPSAVVGQYTLEVFEAFDNYSQCVPMVRCGARRAAALRCMLPYHNCCPTIIAALP
jgi:hypothetical protein